MSWKKARTVSTLLGAGHQVEQDVLASAVKPQAASTGSRLLPGRMHSAMPSMKG
jgi:hypothetical protein